MSNDIGAAPLEGGPRGHTEINRTGGALTHAPGMKEMLNVRVSVPRCVLMSAMPGSGKTQLAMALAEHGMDRLCPDEEMFRRHGQYGVDFPRGQFLVREKPVLEDLAVELRQLLTAGRDVVFDHGFWTPDDRHQWRALVIEAGAVPLMVYLPVPHDVRWARIQERNAKAHVNANAISFSEEDLLRFAGRFFPPAPDEPHLVYDGRMETVLSALGKESETR